MGGYRASGGVRRLAFVAVATFALALIAQAFMLLIQGPVWHWPVAVVGVLCAAILEITWIRVGSIAHRTPVMSVPMLALPALAPVVHSQAAIGMIVFGVLLAILVEARRVNVALYSAGLVGAGGQVTLLIYASIRALGLPELLAVAAAVGGYVGFIIVIEILRVRFTTGLPDLGGRRLLSVPRVATAVLGCASLGVIAALWSATGLPFVERGNESLNAIAVLLGMMVVAAVAKIAYRNVLTRRRLTGLIAGATALASINRRERGAGRVLPGTDSDSQPASDIGDLLCTSIADSVGAESVVIREEPPGPGEIGAPVTLAKDLVQFVVAIRDDMDGAFTMDDRSALEALARAADQAVRSRRKIGGLTARANTDPLTGLPNYGAFQQALANINDHRNYSEAIAVLFIDLDDFKRMNDRYGHQAGDDILRELGRRLIEVVRPHDVVARVGGDEFVIILTELSSLPEANKIAERIMVACGDSIDIGQTVVVPVVSIGLAYSAHRETDVSELVHDADRSMLAIKKSRRRGGPAQESSINISGHRSSEMNDIVVRAIDDDLLELAFQPIVSLVTGQIWAFEALVRYTHPELGPLSPSSLVAKAKSLGRLDKLTQQVAVKAMAAAAEFRLIEPRIICMTINVEAGQIVPERLGTFVADLAEAYPQISLCLELNERSVARVSTAIRSQAEHLRDIGLMIALDDYGSQESSVDALVRVPMDILKIDRSLVDDLDDVRQREVLTALQGFGDKMEYSMIVEGVENETMAAHLGALGIRSAQGFHYGIPQSFANTVARLEEFGARSVLPSGVTTATGTFSAARVAAELTGTRARAEADADAGPGGALRADAAAGHPLA